MCETESKKRVIIKTDDLKIATILDAFSYQVFEPEAELLQLTPLHWKEELETFQSDMLLVESAWRGKDDLWKDTIKNCPVELVGIVGHCKKRGIPTLFWNKEDPYHFDDFVETATLFDFVFTTDIECIPLYRKHLNHKNIFLLPFACQPKIHNPIEKYDRKNAFVFAGAYYKRFPERNKVLKNFVEVLDTISKVVIYDRNYGNKETPFKFPEEYHHFIQGGLAYDEIDKAYKGFKYAINLNSMTTSPTMFSRRVLELMASNTIVLSNYAVSMTVLLGDLVVSTDEKQVLRHRVERLQKYPLFEKKIRLAALRKVMQEHTAEKRLYDIASKIFGQKYHVALPHVLCAAYVENEREVCSIRETFFRQNHSNKQLVLIGEKELSISIINQKDQIFLVDNESTEQVKNFKGIDYVAGWSPDDYYGENYLTDLALASSYSEATIITKSGPYIFDEGEGLTLQKKNVSYQFVSSAAIRSSIIHPAEIDGQLLAEFGRSIKKGCLDGSTILAIDEFNYCQNGISEKLTVANQKVIDDLQEIDTGMVFDDRWIKRQLDILEQRFKKEGQQTEKLESTIGELERKLETKNNRLRRIDTALNELVSTRLTTSSLKKFKNYKKLIAVWRESE